MLGSEPAPVPDSGRDSEDDGTALSLGAQLERAREYWNADQASAAVGAVWGALRVDPEDQGAKALMVHLLRFHPAEAHQEMAPLLLRLLRDPKICPDNINRAGWMLQRREIGLLQTAETESDLNHLATELESDDLTLTLLKESPVGDRPAEKTLTRLRRWMAISGSWRDYPAFVEAVVAQTDLNGGAWPFDEAERSLLDALAGTAMARAYLPDRPNPPSVELGGGQTADRIDRAVAGQYECWPYPVWRRITAPVPQTLPKAIRSIDALVADGLRADASILIAGCGTGQEAAMVAVKYPDARVTAIDISEASLTYAMGRCAALDIRGIRFKRIDLRDVAALGEEFDVIYCSGVLHHLPDPEAGWAALTGVLRPGGVMKIMVYSLLARLAVRGAQELCRDLMPRSSVDRPIDDDLLRRVRHRLLTLENPRAPSSVLNARDFSTLAGTHDLLLHRHEDAFHVPRIARALNRMGLRLLSFILPTPPYGACYDRLFPQDPQHRDFNAWSRFESLEPEVFGGMYNFWCYKPRA